MLGAVMTGKKREASVRLPAFCLTRGCSGAIAFDGAPPAQVHASPPRSNRVATPNRSSGPIGVALVGVDQRLQATLRRALSDSNEFQDAGYFRDAKSALEAIPAGNAELVVIEMVLPDACGILLARTLLGASPSLRTVLVTAVPGPVPIDCAFAASIDDFLAKPVTLPQCLATMRFVTCGLRRSQSASRPPVLTEAQSTPRPQLREVEEKVLACMAKGALYKEIPEQLGITNSQLRRAQHAIFVKLQAQNRTEAVLRWQGLTLP
jgi:DNA-binding NarL/FixJ family response regulator